ncbi:MAG: TonB-dependent receptor [Candidatus Sulfobium sp.]
MNRIVKLMIISIIVATAALPAASEAQVKLKQVVVTATRHEEKTSDVPASVSVITEQDIRNSTAQNIPDLLRTVTGVQVSDITGNRRSYTVDLGGFGETASLNTLVLVDGRRINEADLSGVDWLNIPLDRVRRIEVIRGGRGSVLYGDNATGGVINIITKKGPGGLKAGGNLAGGSYGTFKSGAYAGGTVKDLSLRVSGNYLTSDGYRDNSQTDSKDLGMDATYYARNFMKLDFSTGYHRDRTGLPGALKESDFAAGASRTDSIFPNDFSKTKDYYFALNPEIYLPGDNVLRLDTSFRKRDFQSFSSGDWGNFLGDSTLKTAAFSPRVILKQQISGISNGLTAGIDYEKTDEDIVNDSLFFGTRSLGTFDLKREDVGYYAHDEITVSDNLHLSGGYRYDRASFSFEPSSPRGLAMSADVYTAGINYAFLKKSYAYASYSRSFRYPVLDELYSFITNTVNTTLVPQISDDYEAGVRYYFSDNIFANANVFILDTEKEIIYNPLAYQNENLDGRTRRKGVELSLSAKAAGWLTVRGSYTYMSAKIKSGTFAGNDVPNVPNNKASVDVVCHVTKKAEAILNGIYIGKRPFISDFSNDFTDQASYLVLNAKFTYRWKSLTAFLDINNLTDKKYSEYGVIGGFPLEKAFYPSPRTNFLVGLSVDL